MFKYLFTIILSVFISSGIAFAEDKCINYDTFREAQVSIHPEYFKMKEDSKVKFFDNLNKYRASKGLPAIPATDLKIARIKHSDGMKIGFLFLAGDCILVETISIASEDAFWDAVKDFGLTREDFVKDVYSEGSA